MVKGISPVLGFMPRFKGQSYLRLWSAISKPGASPVDWWSCENSVSWRKPGAVLGRPGRSSTFMTMGWREWYKMLCPCTDVTQPNSSVPSGTPPALLPVGSGFGQGWKEAKKPPIFWGGSEFSGGPSTTGGENGGVMHLRSHSYPQAERHTHPASLQAHTAAPPTHGYLSISRISKWEVG